MRLAFQLILATILLASAETAWARHPGADAQRTPTIAPPAGATDNPSRAAQNEGLASEATTDTTWLHSANFNGNPCNTQGWTSVDRTADPATYWHVDDYAGLSFGPVAGTKSLWCGARPGGGDVLCQYLTLPGYGNGWNQSWCTKNCIPIAGGPTSDLDVSFAIRFGSEPSYDYTTLEFTEQCSGNQFWQQIDGGVEWSGVGQTTVSGSYGVFDGPVKVRLHFRSDTSWSDQDGLYPSNGAVHIDSLKVETLPIEFFEDEAVGATQSNDWQSCNTPGYGDFASLMRGSDLLQEDPCTTNLSCMWAFIKNSTVNYACGGHPEQAAVPYVNSRGQYISNEIWSPPIPISGSGSTLNLQFDVYRDLLAFSLSNVFYVWHVRTFVNGCPTAWKDRNFLYEGNDKAWFRHVENVGSLVNLTNATHIQFAIGVIDMCGFYCWGGPSVCHSHAPLLDNVKIYRVNVTGPNWNVRNTDLFQDTFATNGTITGTARADMALDIKPSYSPNFTPGDSAVVLSLIDPAYAVGAVTDASGLLNDPNISTFIGRHKTKKQVYMWVAVWPQGQPNKSGDGLSEGPGGQANRYPHIPAKDYVDVNGVTWTAIRADYTYVGTASNPGNGHPAPSAPAFSANRFNVDLNDNLFTPGDTVCFFYGASSAGGTNYYSDQWHITENIAEVAANPMEFTVLPAGGFNRGGDILYVDGADGLGVQPYYEGAFMVLGLDDKVDRYDVRGPSSAVSNTPAGRVRNIAAQLNACYRGIIWDCGSLPVTLGDGTGNPNKADDYALLNTFLGNLTIQGGVYLAGDDVAERLAASAALSASTFKSTYMPFTLASGNHIAAGLGVSPKIVHWPGRSFVDDFTVFGGCPQLNDFDVLNASGSSRVEMSYVTAQSVNGAVVSNSTINGLANATVMLSGFSLAQVRDDDLNGISDRAKFLRDLLIPIVSGLPQVTGADPALSNSLAQNYPNPFNPQTTIAFSLKSRGHVALSVYDVNGALIRTLANDTRAAGAHDIKWDGRDDHGHEVASGVYFYRLVATGFTQTKKMVLLK